MARGGHYSNGARTLPMVQPYNENYNKYGGPPPGPPPPPKGPPPGAYPGGYRRDRLTRSSYPSKNNGTLVRGGRVGTLKVLAAGQLVVGVMLLVLGVVCIALGPLNMSMALLTGMCVLWCPVGSMTTGVVGLFLSRGNTRDFVCVRRSYQVMCLMNAVLFMALLALTTGFVQLRFFDTDTENISANEKLLIGFLGTFPDGAVAGGMELEGLEPKDITGYLSLAAFIITLCLLNEIFAIISITIICCGAPFAIDQPEPEVIVAPRPLPDLRPEPYGEDVMPRRMPVEREPYYPMPEPVYYPEPEPNYLPRSRALSDVEPPRRSELALVPVRRHTRRRDTKSPYDGDTRSPHDGDTRSPYDGEAEYMRNYYDNYYKDYERMMSKFKDARRKYGTIRAEDFDRHVGPSRRSRRKRARSFDVNSYGDHYADRRDVYADRRDVYADRRDVYADRRDVYADRRDVYSDF